MSIYSCANCGDIYDTDFQMEINKKGDCICDRCWETGEKKCLRCGRIRGIDSDCFIPLTIERSANHGNN